MTRILIAEDEERIAAFLEKGLRANGFETLVSSDGAEALRLAHSGAFELLILDLGLPGKDGLEVLRELRGQGFSFPVVVLTARSATHDIVAGLDRGADDYVTKPFRFDELLTRVRLRLRGDRKIEPTVLEVGDAVLDLRTRRATVQGVSLDLSPREFALAEVFFRHPAQVLSRAQLYSSVWGSGGDADSNVIDVYVGYLRRKLGRDRIATIRGAGYRLERLGASPARHDLD